MAGEKAIIIIMLLGLGLLAGAYLLHSHASMPSWLGGTKLLAEYSDNGTVVLSQAINPSPGSIWKLEQTPSGLMFKQLDSRLVEELELTNITLAGGDVVAPVLYDWYFDGQDDAVVYGLHLPSWSSLNLTFAGEVFDVNHWGAAVGGFGHRPEANRFLAFVENKYNAGFRVVLTLYNATSGEAIGGVERVFMPSPTGYHVFSAVVTTGGSLEVYVDGEVKCSGTFDTTDVYFPLDVDTTYAVGARTIYGEVSVADFSKSRISYALVEADGRILSLVSATFTNETHYFDLITGNAATVYGDPARIPSEHPRLWLVKSLVSDGKLHLRFFPANTVIKIKDRVTGQEWTYTISGVQNAAGLVEDYAITLPTSNPVDITAYVPSERVRFYAPDGFVVRLSDPNTGITTENKVTDGKVTLAGGTTVQLIAPNGEKSLVLSVDETPAVYKIIVKRPDGTPSDAYVWVRDAAGNLIAYGKTTNGVYELAKKPGIPSTIRVEAQELSGGTWYHASRDFQLVENNEPVTVTPQPQGLSGILGHSNVVWGLAVAFVFALLAAAIIAIIRG